MVLDLGLLGGWAAGGVAVEAGNMSKSPAGAVDAANADVNALAGAFRQLVDAFAVEPAAGGIDTAGAAPASDPPAPAPSASPVPPVVVSDMFQPNANVANADLPAGSPLRRFTSHATTAAPAAETHDESGSVEIPFSLFAPALEPRADATDTNRTMSAKPANDANDAVDADAESESHVEQAGQSSVVLTPMPTLMPMPPQDVKPAPTDTNTTSGRSAVNESEPRVAMPASETARPASASTQMSSKPSPRSVPQSGPQFPLSSAPVEIAAVDATDPAPIAVRAAESIPVNVAIAMAAMNAAAPSSRAPRANETSREPRVNLRTGINANANINTNAQSDTIDVDRTPATFRLSQDAVRPAQAPSETVPAALRLTASLLAAGYVPGAAARQFVSSNSTGAASASTSPVVVIPFVMPSTTSGLASLASPSTVDLPMTPSDVESAAPQIIQTIKLSWSRSDGEAHIRLDPRQFGDLSVSIRLDGGQVVARLQADAPAVREWLQTNQRTLQDGLAEHQLKLTRFEVVAPGEDAKDPSGKDTREQHDDAQGRPARRPKRQEHGERFEVVA